MMCAGVTAHGEILKGDLVSAGEAGTPHIANPLLGIPRRSAQRISALMVFAADKAYRRT